MAIEHMLITLILIGWLAVAIVCVAVCAMAARGDSVSIESQEEGSCEPGMGRSPHTAVGKTDPFAAGERPALEKNPIELLLYDTRGVKSGTLTSHGVR